MIPGIVFYFLFHYIPMYGITLAFKDFMFNKGILGSPWVGFKHLETLFSNPKFWLVTRNTLIISFGRVLFEFPVPIILALLLNELHISWFKRTVQSVMYFPYFLSWVIIYTLMFNLLSYDTGIVNNMLAIFGAERINFFSTPALFRPLIYTSNIWKMAGYGTILYLASISGINPELYDSATVDGANRFQQIIHITLPGMKTIILTVFILLIGNSLGGANVANNGFFQVFNLYNPSVYEVGDIIDTYVYREGITKGLFSYATAAGFFKSVINLTLLLVVDKISRRVNGVGLYM